MIPHHVEVQAFGIHRVAADLTGYSTSRLGHRLFQQGRGFWLPSTPDEMPGLLAFRLFATR
jgi:hypothetical protein